MANSKKKGTKKTTPKKSVKEEVKKEIKEEVKPVVVKEEKEEKKLLDDFKIAILYLICAVCWLLSGILDYVATKKMPYFDCVITAVLVLLAIVYFKKNKNKK